MRFVFDLRASDEPSMRWAKSAPSLTIGRQSECDLVLVSELVSAKHAAIDGLGTTAVLRDLGSTNGTYLNGTRVSEPTPVRVGDTIAFGVGGTTLIAVALEPGAKRSSTLVLQPPAAFVPDRTVRVGRASDNDVVLDDPSVSAHHARVLLDRFGHGVVEDLGSTNGVAVGNLARKTTRAEFSSGDLIYFGSAAVAADTFLASPPAAPQVGPSKQTNRKAERSGQTIRTVAPETQTNRSVLRQIGIPAAACVVCAVLAVFGFAAFRQGKPSAASDDRAVAKTEVQTGHDALAVAPAEKPAQPKHESAEDVESVVRRVQPAVVWLAIRHKDYLFPIAAAWAAKPTVVVTTAQIVTELKRASEKPDMKIVAWSNGREIAADSFHAYSKYSESDSSGDARVRFNVGTVRLSAPIAVTLEVAPQETVRSLDSTTPLLVVGVFSSLKDFDPYDRLKLRFEHARVALRSTEYDRPGLAPVFVVDISAPKEQSAGRWLDGAPILDPNGSVVGILAGASDKVRMVPIPPFVWNQDF